MIKLDVQEYCQEFPYFEAVMVPEYCNKREGRALVEMVATGDTLIKCNHWHMCESAVTTALRLKEEEK